MTNVTVATFLKHGNNEEMPYKLLGKSAIDLLYGLMDRRTLH